MKIKYFQDTDTLLLILSEQDVFETKDVDENTILDLDKYGQVVSITIEHAKERINIDSISFEQIKSDVAA
jgi:uncharacterized protein YuzE